MDKLIRINLFDLCLIQKMFKLETSAVWNIVIQFCFISVYTSYNSVSSSIFKGDPITDRPRFASQEQ